MLLVAGTTREHLGLALALQVPIFVVVSKVDLCPEMITTRTVTQLQRLLTGCRKVPFEIKSDDDAVTAARTFNESRYTSSPLLLPLLGKRDYEMSTLCVGVCVGGVGVL